MDQEEATTTPPTAEAAAVVGGGMDRIEVDEEQQEPPQPHHHQQLEAMGVKELKLFLEARRVPYRDCVEKKDLVKRARDNLHLPPVVAPSTSKPASPASSTSTSTTSPSGHQKIGGLDCVVQQNGPHPAEWVCIVLHVRPFHCPVQAADRACMHAFMWWWVVHLMG